MKGKIYGLAVYALVLVGGSLGCAEKGTAGSNGTQGPIGAEGARGPVGPQGPQGPAGSVTVDLTDGGVVDPDSGVIIIQGAQGPQGAQGIPGPAGDAGAQGPQGIQGVQGAQGVQGIAGPNLVWLQSDGGVIGTYAGHSSVFVPSMGCNISLSYQAPYYQLVTLTGQAAAPTLYTSLNCTGTPYVLGTGGMAFPDCVVASQASGLTINKVVSGVSINIGSQYANGSCTPWSSANPQVVAGIAPVGVNPPDITPPFTLAQQ